jgi:APA family basic amino acid/polyamine antiporter
MNLILLGIGAIVGAGIFVLTGNAAAHFAGPVVTISFIVAGLACALAGLCYAELAAMIPIAGSTYTYSYTAFGEIIAWLIGWNLIFEYLFGASTVAAGWSGYIADFLDDFGIVIPAYLCNAPFDFDHLTHTWNVTGDIINLPAMFIIVLLTMILVKGIGESARLNNIMVFIKLVVIFLFIGFGISYIRHDNWTPFIPPNRGTFGNFGISGIFRAAGIIFFAYIGFDAVSTAAQESKDPQKDMPWGILGSLAICTVLYVLFTLVLTGMVNYTELSGPAPVATAMCAAGDHLRWLRGPIEIGALAGLSSVILVYLLGQSRIFYAMSMDGLIPPLFKKVHPKYGSPYFSTIFTGVSAALIAGLFPLNLLGELVSIGTLLAFSMVSLGVIVLRYKHPEYDRPFKAPFFPYLPALGVIVPFGVMLSMPFDTWIRLIIWIVLGAVIYFSYGIKKSALVMHAEEIDTSTDGR